jgi:hypothetical protein
MATVVSIRITELNEMVPPGVRDFIQPQQWSTISQAFRDEISAKDGLACMIEWGVCCCFLFPCIFCCHSCITDGFRKQGLAE